MAIDVKMTNLSSRSRVVRILTVLSIALLIPLGPSNAAIKVGSACKKAQQVRIVKGVELRCVTKGKRLVWRKSASAPVVVPAVEVAPSPSPSANPMPTASPPPTPSTATKPFHERPDFSQILWSRSQGSLSFPLDSENFAIPDQSPTSWDDIYEKRDGIAYKAWKSVHAVISKSPSNLGTIKKYQGPNSVLTFEDIDGAFDLVSRAFPGVAAVPQTNVFIYNYGDRTWADTNFRQIYQNEDERFNRHSMNSVLENCQDQRQVCWAMAFTDSRLNGVVLLGVVEKGSPIDIAQTYSEYSRSTLGLTVAHEYFHVLQRREIGDKWFQRDFTPPSWFHEGTAVFVENAVMNHLSFDKYMRFRLADSKLAYPGCKDVSSGCFTVDEETLKKFFSLSNYENNWNVFPYGMKYEVSARIAEILVAIKGHESILNLYKEMAKSQTFSVAFEKVYGISYEKATPIITRILVDQFAKNN